MTDWLRTGGLVLVGLIALLVIVEVVSILLSIVSWIVSLLVSLVLVALLLGVVYWLFTEFVQTG
ncbi:hypothetical protein ACLI4Q_05205 [Natrialbaceae archaeon A-CW1-1]